MATWGKHWRTKHDLGRGYATWDWIVGESWLQDRPHLTGIPQHIQAHIFRRADEALAALDAQLGEHERDSGRSLVKIFLWYRMVYLQDAVFMRPLHRSVYDQFPEFASPAFTEWFEQVWTPHVLRLHEEALERLRIAREKPVGGTQLESMLAAQSQHMMQSWQAEFQKLKHAAHNLVPGSPVSHVDAAVIIRSAEKLGADFDAASSALQQQPEQPAPPAAPVARLEFPSADESRVAFSGSGHPQVLWKELTVGLHEGATPLLDRLDPTTFNLRRSFTWQDPKGAKPGKTRKAWGGRKPAMQDIFRQCDPSLRGAELHTQGLPYLDQLMKAMEQQSCASLEVFYKNKGFQQLAS